MANAAEYGLFVPTTYVWDVEQLQNIDLNSPQGKELIVRLYQNINLITTVLNLKISGYYDTQEFVTGQNWFPLPGLTSSSSTTPDFRPNYRMVVIFGALPNTTIKSVPHGIPINDGYTITHCYAGSFNPTTLVGLQIGYASVTGDNIEIYIDATNVNIITASDRSAFTNTVVVIEYLKF